MPRQASEILTLLEFYTYSFSHHFQQILSVDENEIVKEIIEKVYRKGADDKVLLSGLPVTESGYYRLKRKLEGKIYELYIVRGDVTQDEILSNKLL